MFKIEIVGDSLYDLRQKINRVYEELNEREGHIANQPSLPVFPLTGPTCSDNAVFGKAPQMEGLPSIQAFNALPITAPPFDPLALGNNMVAAPPVAAPSIAGDQAQALDVKGIPHDLRIHSANKSKNLDGTWRYKRGVDDAAIATIENSYKGTVVHAVAAPAALPSFPPPPAVTTPYVAPIAPPQAVVAPVVVAPVVVEPVAAPAIPQVGVKPAHSLITFKNNLTELLAQFINEGKINQEYVASLCAYFKIKDIWNVLGSETQCMELFDVFVKAGFVTRIEG